MTSRFEELQQAAGDVSRETLDRLTEFEAEFNRWASKINLMSARDRGDLWHRHILDSAQLNGIVPADRASWTDIGSGGGFPGAVMAILWAEARTRFSLIESNARKGAFLRTALGKLPQSPTILTKRIEEAGPDLPRAEVVTARALASLGMLFGYAHPLLSADGGCYFHKGRGHRAEVEEARLAWSFDVKEHASRTDAEARILEIRNLRPR